jgi:hypothetical protein
MTINVHKKKKLSSSSSPSRYNTRSSSSYLPPLMDLSRKRKKKLTSTLNMNFGKQSETSSTNRKELGLENMVSSFQTTCWWKTSSCVLRHEKQNQKEEEI